MEIRLKRIYDEASPDDGFRVLVDRLWPRGVSKERAALDLWDKDVAPSTELREAWHAAPPENWADFVGPYMDQLAGPSAAALANLASLAAQHDVTTLLYAAHDSEHTHALVLRDALQDAMGGGGA